MNGSYIETFIAELIGYHNVKKGGGSPVTKRSTLHFLGPVVGRDNPSAGETDLDFSATLDGSSILSVALSASANDYDPGWEGYRQLSITPTESSYGLSLTGLASPSAAVELLVVNVGPQSTRYDVVLRHESSSSVAGNRFSNHKATDIRLSGAGDAALLLYDDTALRWRMMRVN